MKGLRERGFTADRVREWLIGEGIHISDRTLREFLADTIDPERREHLQLRSARRDEENARVRRSLRRSDIVARANVARRERLDASRARHANAVRQWFENPDFNPET